MNFKSMLLAATGVLLIATGSLSAQTTGRTYTLQECITAGLQRNADILRGKNSVERAVAQKTQAFGQFLPSVSASGSWSRYDQDQIGLRANDLFHSRNSYSYAVRSGLVLFDGLSNFNNADKSILSYQAAQQGYAQREQDIVFGIQQRFFNTLRTLQLVKVNEANLERSRKQLERVKEMNTVGSVPLADVYRQQVQVGRDELALLNAQNDANNARVDLVSLIGVSPVEPFEINASSVPTTVDDAEMTAYHTGLAPYATLVEQAMARRADVQQAELSFRSADKAVSAAWGGHLPTLSAFAQYSWNNLELKDFAIYDRFVYGLSIDVPIFSNFQVSTSVQSAQIDRSNAEYTKTELSRTIAADIQKALNNLSTAEKNVEISRRTLQSAQEDHRIATERYTLGSGTLLDQLVAASNLTSAESDVINAGFNYIIARRQLDYQLGNLNY